MPFVADELRSKSGRSAYQKMAAAGFAVGALRVRYSVRGRNRNKPRVCEADIAVGIARQDRPFRGAEDAAFQ